MLQKSHHTMSRDALGGAERLPQSGDKTERQRQRGRNTEKQRVRDRVREWTVTAGISLNGSHAAVGVW